MLILLSQICAFLPHIYMLVSMMSLISLNLCAFMPCHNPLLHHMICMMTTLVWWIASWMLGFALTLPNSFFQVFVVLAHFEGIPRWCNIRECPFRAARRWVCGDRPLRHGTAISFPWWFGFRSEVGSFPRGRGWCGASYGHHHVKSPFGKWHVPHLLHIHKGESSPLHVFTLPLRGWHTTWHSTHVHA